MWNCVIGLVAVLFPSVLLYPDGQGFYVDWANHVWMVGYYGEYFRQHGSMPVVMNTAEVGGIAFPIFYGYLFYPLLGLAATHLHPEVVVRAAVVLLFAAQYVCVRCTFRRLHASEGLATGAACLTIWSTYALTNLYNRSALTEFFAVGVLTCAACAWFDLLCAESPGAVWRRGLRFGLLLTLAIGFHPITGLYSLPLLAVLLFAVPARRAPLGRVVVVCVVAALASSVALAPWVYAVQRFESDLGIADFKAAVSTGPLIDPIDRWRTRLNPLPTDIRCDTAAPKDVSTPYLDGQISLPLLVLGGALAVAAVRRASPRWWAAAFLIPPLAYTAAMLGLSLSPRAFDYLPGAFRMVQFLYRLVSYVNIGFLLLPLFALLWAARNHPPAAPAVTVPPVLLCFVLTHAGFCVFLKLQHAEVARIPAEPFVQSCAARGQVYDPAPGHRRWVKNAADRAALTHLPLSFYGCSGYSTPRTLRGLNPDEGIPAGVRLFGVEPPGPGFGNTLLLTVTLDHPALLATEVLVFPWNQFELDGQPVPVEGLRAWDGAGKCTAILVPAGTHTISHRFEPDRIWLRLHAVSRVILLVWVVALVVLEVVRLVSTRRTSGSPLSLPVLAQS